MRQVEWKLVEMPLPRLQVIGDHEDPFIYRISWSDRIRKGEFDDPEFFDNLIRFVVSDPGCNRHKFDHLAAGKHVETWLDRAERQASHLEAIAEEAHWERHPARSLGVARSIYLRLPADAMLWQLGKRFVPVDRPELTRVFAVAGRS